MYCGSFFDCDSMHAAMSGQTAALAQHDVYIVVSFVVDVHSLQSVVDVTVAG
jgi:hypothetical protein